jgi:hypothetical protein
MPLVWTYFTLSSNRVAHCKADKCTYSKDYPPEASTNSLRSHLRTTHNDLFKELQKQEEEEKARRSNFAKENPLKRAFAASSSIEINPDSNENDDNDSPPSK